jgi:hypothetical protein
MDNIGTPPRIDSLAAFADALRWGFLAGVADGTRCFICVDPGFELWPLDDEALLEPLTAWLRLPQRRLVLLAASYDDVPRRLPRFTTWRRDWAHAIQALQCPQEFAAELPSLLIDDRRTCVHLIDPVHGRGRAERDARSRLLWQEKVDVVLQRSEPAFAVTTLGL